MTPVTWEGRENLIYIGRVWRRKLRVKLLFTNRKGQGITEPGVSMIHPEISSGAFLEWSWSRWSEYANIAGVVEPEEGFERPIQNSPIGLPAKELRRLKPPG